MPSSINSPVKEVAPPQTSSWFGVDLPTWSSRIASSFAEAKEAALRENEELQIRTNVDQRLKALQQRVEELEYVVSEAIKSRVLTAQSAAS